MKVISSSTLVTGSPEGPVDHAPGTAVDLPAEDARDLIARGIARPANATLPEATNTEQETEGTGEPMEEVEGDTLEAESEAETPADGPDLNTASATALRANIDGVGPKTARDLIAARNEKPFESLQDAADRVGGVSLEMLIAARATV